jgi:hypothetical protein
LIYRLLADLVVVAHLVFVAFAVLGGLLVVRWRRCAWLHVPAAFWAVLVEFAGWVCPLTPLETWLRVRAGGTGYAGGFIDHYVAAILYPPGLTRGVQIALGLGLLVANAAIYAWALRRSRGRARS